MGQESIHQELIQRAVSGDRVALTVLLSTVQPRILAQLQRRIPKDLQSVVDADDLAQETQIEAFRHIGTFVPRGEDAFDRWVATIALRRLRNAIKARRTLKRGGATFAAAIPEESAVMLLGWIAGSERTPSHHAARQEAVTALQRAMSELPDHYQQAVRLVYIEGRSVAEAAIEMDRTQRAVHNLCHKSKEFLRAHLGSASRFLSRS